jgi:cell division topological specificity factor
MLELLQRILGKDTYKASKGIATERLRLVLVHDRIDLTPQMMDSLRDDILRVVTHYLEIDESNVEISLSRAAPVTGRPAPGGGISLVASIPILRMKRLPVSEVGYRKSDTG